MIVPSAEFVTAPAVSSTPSSVFVPEKVRVVALKSFTLRLESFTVTAPEAWILPVASVVLLVIMELASVAPTAIVTVPLSCMAVGTGDTPVVSGPISLL